MKRGRALALSALAWVVGVPVAHGVLPWALSLVGPRYAGLWNGLGVAPLVFGCALLVWVAVTGLSRAPELPERLEVNWQPKLLIASGPYRLTRNPMYVGELALWLGWALYFGSPLVAAGAALLFAAMTRAIRREERDLDSRFGEEFRAYAASVPRWLGRPSR